MELNSIFQISQIDNNNSPIDSKQMNVTASFSTRESRGFRFSIIFKSFWSFSTLRQMMMEFI